MRKGGYSRLGVFGTMNHYDNSGYKIGESRPGLFGSVNTYDSSGDRISRRGCYNMGAVCGTALCSQRRIF